MIVNWLTEPVFLQGMRLIYSYLYDVLLEYYKHYFEMVENVGILVLLPVSFPHKVFICEKSLRFGNKNTLSSQQAYIHIKKSITPYTITEVAMK